MIHAFEVETATKFGVIEAILISNFQYWLLKNKANNHNLFDGSYWTYNSIPAFQKLFPYLTEKQIRYHLEKLIQKDVLITGNYNNIKFDKTLWYAFKDEKKWLSGSNSRLPKLADRIPQKGKCYYTDSKPYKLSILLYEKLKEINPTHKEPNLQTWAKHVDDMIRIDKREPEEIEKLIEWLFIYKSSNGFHWKTVILSTKKLREKYDQLQIAKNQTGSGSHKRGEFDSDKFERLLNNPPE